jgi:hypothetical protein
MTFFASLLQVFTMGNDNVELSWDEKLWFSEIELLNAGA